MVCNGVRDLLHYLADFLVFGTAGAQEANLALTCALETCRRLGFQVAHEKVEGPSSCLTFLGIEIDTVASEVRLPSTKLSRLQQLLNEWLSRRSSTKRQLQSLLGYLYHAATVVRPGRMFTLNLIEAIRRTDRPHHFVRLNSQCRADLLLLPTNGTGYHICQHYCLQCLSHLMLLAPGVVVPTHSQENGFN